MAFSATELADFKAAHVETFSDVCSIKRMSVTYDGYGQPIFTPTTTSNVSCGVQYTGGLKTVGDTVITVPFDCVIRLPVSTPTINLNDEIVITSHLGNVVNDTFKVWSIPSIGTVMLIQLKRVVN